jgi:hypothetical protein
MSLRGIAIDPAPDLPKIKINGICKEEETSLSIY